MAKASSNKDFPILMDISSNIVLTESEIEKLGTTLNRVKETLTLPNTQYENISRFGKSKWALSKIPKYLCYLKEIGGRYVLPRYYFGTTFSGIIDKDYRIKGAPLSNATFMGTLREYQQNFLADTSLLDNSGVLLEAGCGSGKCHGKGTKILMYDGTVKNVEDIVVGDQLMGDDSTPRTVLSLARGREELFKIHQVKGEDYVVNKSHILSLQYRPWGSQYRINNKNRYAHEHYGDIVDVPLEDYLNLSKTKQGHLYGYCVPVDYPEQAVKIPPYLLGLWLGDGTSKEVSFTCDHRDTPIIDYYYEVARNFGLRIRVEEQKDNNANIYHLVGTSRDSRGHSWNPLRELFKEYALLDNKHIPREYLINSRKNRLALLAGLLDTDGSYSNGGYDFVQRKKWITEEVRTLCWSLGFRAKMTKKVINGTPYWRLHISGGNLCEIPCRLPRKQADPRRINKNPYVNGISVESIGEGDYYGFVLDGNHRYCLRDGTVTHNTVLGIYLSLARGKKTLVLVPTYYLAKQWKERIDAFTRCTCQILTSKDSKIRTDSDFTIAVMDLFSVRVLPSDLVDNIGTVVLDEAHRVGAETYMPILDEIPAYYRIALTATFRRADGVHKILQYHFGTHYKMESRFPRPRVYGVDTGVTFDCLCSKNKPYQRALDFFDEIGVPYTETRGAIAFPQSYNGEELSITFSKYAYSHSLGKVHVKEVITFLHRGKDMQYATVDTYLNENCRRMKTTVRLIQECLDAGRTVLFLSKRKDTLKALTGYFAKYRPMLIVSETNSRSEEDEKYLQTECRLIFGVIQLAKEGLDIDRLDTLIIHLPMKDTEQAVGRISRLHPSKQFPVCFYLLDNTPVTWAVFKNAKKFFSINGDFVQVVNLPGVRDVLAVNKEFKIDLEDSK